MATPAQIANDLEEHGKALNGRGHDMLCRSLARGAKMVRQLLDTITQRETEISALRIRAIVMERDMRALEQKQDGQSLREVLYQRAVGHIVLSQRFSVTSVQQALGLKRESAVKLLEQAEKDGIVSAADHLGRRRVVQKLTALEVSE